MQLKAGFHTHKVKKFGNVFLKIWFWFGINVRNAEDEKAKQIIEHDLTDFTLRNYQNFHAMIDTFNQEYKLPGDFEKSFLAEYRIISLEEK